VNNVDCVLFVDRNSHHLLHNIHYMSQIYGAVKTLYPSFKSLHLANTNFMDFLKSSKIQLYSLEVV
jgi:hypothetical protein